MNPIKGVVVDEEKGVRRKGDTESGPSSRWGDADDAARRPFGRRASANGQDGI